MRNCFKNKLIISIVVVSFFIVALSLYSNLNKYESISIEEAYNNNFISSQELEEIYNIYERNKKIELDKDVENKIKKSYIKRFDLKIEYEDVFINCYGKCNDYYILSISNNKIHSPAVEETIIIGNLEFNYTSGKMIELWYKK